MTTTVLQRGVADYQSEMYAQALILLMNRTNDNTELVNSMRDFIRTIQMQAWFGETDEPISDAKVQRLTEFFQKQTKELQQLR